MTYHDVDLPGFDSRWQPDEPPPTDPWPAPIPLAAPSVVPPFPVSALPGPVAAFVEETAEATGTAVDFAATAALVVAAGMIGASRCLRMKGDYFAGTRLYAALVGGPGSGKTPAIRQTSAPLFTRQLKLKAEHDAKMADYEIALEKWKQSQKQSFRDSRDLRDADGEAIESAVGPEPKRPVLTRCWSDDATVEALGGILAENPRGVTFVKDELAGLIRNLNAYKGGKGADRQFYLSAWSGEPVGIDRKGRPDPLLIPHPWLSILGGIQPDLLGELRDQFQRQDGFLERFLFAFPDEPPMAGWSERSVRETTKKNWSDALERLTLLTQKQGEHGPMPVACSFSRDAKAAWTQRYDAHVAEANAAKFPASLVGYWSKLRDYAGRLALILQLLHDAAENINVYEAIVDVPAASGAWELVGYFKGTYRRVVSQLAADPEVAKAERVLAWVRRERPEQFRRHDVHQDVRNDRWFSRIEDVDEPLRRLCEHHYLRRLDPQTSGVGRPRNPVYLPHPDLLRGIP